MIGSGVKAPSEIEQLFLPIRKPAFGGDAAEPMRQLAVVLPGICRPRVPVGDNLLQCERVFI
jgi:hypothetical protein